MVITGQGPAQVLDYNLFTERGDNIMGFGEELKFSNLKLGPACYNQRKNFFSCYLYE